ncbi:peptidoglycan DD-metalloendopeptidase family protein [Rhodobacter sp. Har01]|uniref:murein hydrolase activator EnvC family protein n=1 Tax=Rhodobacter sp. Har01 TaxID=2883999 RepID=UPI001D06DF87|nr:peptidoglycan DD-metalloendopeptidase family protein [Rhodobacter sp. Har01]MCB6179808.1 peptidoglycan DD-metalloendopeptidase family protein [Rhodobacter sp. Har01]
MIRRAALLLALLALPAVAETVAEQAEKASADLTAAIAALQTAEASRDRVAALTQTIRAYELGQAAMREAMRQAELRQTTLAMRFDTKRERIAQLLGVLERMELSPGPLLLLHPEGPLGTARSGMMLAEVTPALQAEAEALKAELQELADLRALQSASAGTLAQGLAAAQDARTALSKAISDRTDLPKRFAEAPEELRLLVESADTLESLAAGLALNTAEAGNTSFAGTMGALPLPAMGTLILRPDEPDTAGVRRPGMALATRPRALVTAPWPATIRYIGPLLDYGNVIVLEPGDGYLLVLAGLGTLYGEVGNVVAADAPLGLMGGTDTVSAEPTTADPVDTGARDTETLYLELRLGAAPVDPTEWFAATATTGN